MPDCQECGTKNPEGARYCSGCGTRLSIFPKLKKKEKKSFPRLEKKSEKPEKSNSELKLQVILALIILILIIVAILMSFLPGVGIKL
ncbi:MAG: zinc-ribbon domain-containing protein [Methanobacteriaceae archaeon]